MQRSNHEANETLTNVNARQAYRVHGSRHPFYEVLKPQTNRTPPTLGLIRMGPLGASPAESELRLMRDPVLFLGGAPREPPLRQHTPKHLPLATARGPWIGGGRVLQVSDARLLSSHLGGECKRHLSCERLKEILPGFPNVAVSPLVAHRVPGHPT